jgi:signal transduction histidine kinase
VGVAVLALVSVQVTCQRREHERTQADWEGTATRVVEDAVASIEATIAQEVERLDRLAARAISAPSEPVAAFNWLRNRLDRAPHDGIVLYDEVGPVAWAGELRSPTQWRTDSGSLDWSPFYVTLRRTTQRGARRVVAEAVVHATPPADRIAIALESLAPRTTKLVGFEFEPPGLSGNGWYEVRLDGRPFLSVRPLLLSRGEAALRMTEKARVAGALGLLLTVALLVGSAWRRPASSQRRFMVLCWVIGIVATIPFNAFSNLSVVFDPGVYYASTLGPLSGSVAALTMSSALTLLALFTLARSHVRVGGRGLAAIAVVGIAALAPFLLRDLARGVALPGRGASIPLWLSWQVPLFLAAATILLAGAMAGRMVLGRGRGGSPWIGPALAALAAIAAPVLWQAPARWPAWYIGLWIVAVGSLALARQSRALSFAIGVVAACGATTLTWYAVSRARVQLAETDVRHLSTPDPAARELLARLVDSISVGSTPRERSDLLRQFVRSPLAEAGQPIELAHWPPGASRPGAEIRIADFSSRVEGEGGLVARARLSGEVVWETATSAQGRQVLAGVPHPDGSVTSIVLAPRSLLIEPDPFTMLVGLSRPITSEPPYDLVLTPLPSPTPLTEQPSWARKGNELHGDWLVPGAGPDARVHVEIDLRGIDVLIPRGTLMVILDLLIFGIIWTLAAIADGGFWRWAKDRMRTWGRSYRGRLTITLFGFFVIPAVVFALWSYRRTNETDSESRALLLRETLRAVVTVGNIDDLEAVAERFDTPLLGYRGGALYRTSDPLYAQLAPVGQFLPPEVAIGLGVEAEVSVTSRPRLAGVPTLFGYRTVELPDGVRAVLAAPARVSERALDRQRRDIAILVLFVTSLGALAALWLSGLAARELERPVGALRRAALRIARGERYPRPDVTPALEFVPVFSAIERMDADLAASRTALEEAQRRTESVLRDVASGVVAVDPEGRVLLSNPGAEAIIGRAVTAGQALGDLPVPALSERVAAFLRSAADEDAFDMTIGTRQVRGSLTRLTRAGGGAVLTLEDVTELARAQRVLAWGEMARQVAHEIKNPLTPIRLGVQHMRRARGDQRVDFERIFEQNVERILSEIDRLDEIARSFSRFGMAPAERADPVALDVAAVARDVVDLERLGETRIEWSIAGADAPVMALARDDELREVLLNVLENARQAGALHIAVDVRREDGAVDLVVTDDGSGVAITDLTRIFEPRFSTRTSGSGLGLAISRQLVEAWGGRMHASRATGGGTEFRISLVPAPPG